jgi:hypothetical protein
MVKSCLTEIGDWQCRGGFLIQDAQEASTYFPCPKCNTERFLVNAKMIAEDKRASRLTCPCCDRNSSPAEKWLSALRAAQDHNVGVLDDILPRIGIVSTFDQDRKPIEFRYDVNLPSLPSLVARRRFNCESL